MTEHCWHALGWVRLSYPPQYPDGCCRCGSDRTRSDPLTVEGEQAYHVPAAACVSDDEAREYQARQRHQFSLAPDAREKLRRAAAHFEARERTGGGYTGAGPQVLRLLDQLTTLEHEIESERAGLRGGQLGPPYGLHELEVKALRLQKQIRQYAEGWALEEPGPVPVHAAPPPRARRHILVIDDGYSQASLYHDLLTYQGYQITQVSLAALAYSSDQYECPDLILLDWVFGQEGPGMQALHHLKLWPSTVTIPILVCAVPTNAVGDLAGYLRSKDVAMVAKPCTAEELATAIEAAMGNAATWQPLA